MYGCTGTGGRGSRPSSAAARAPAASSPRIPSPAPNDQRSAGPEQRCGVFRHHRQRRQRARRHHVAGGQPRLPLLGARVDHERVRDRARRSRPRHEGALAAVALDQADRALRGRAIASGSPGNPAPDPRSASVVAARTSGSSSATSESPTWSRTIRSRSVTDVGASESVATRSTSARSWRSSDSAKPYRWPSASINSPRFRGPRTLRRHRHAAAGAPARSTRRTARSMSLKRVALCSSRSGRISASSSGSRSSTSARPRAIHW